MPCKRKINMRSAVDRDNSLLPYEYILNDDPFKIKKIMCYSGTNIPLYLLAIEEKRKRCHKDACVYNKREKIDAYCIKDAKYFAHIYISTESKRAFIKHYIVAFVKRRDLEKHDDLVKILLNTVKWLKIKDGSPHFYIYYDCHGDSPAVNLSIHDIRKVIIDKLKKQLLYSKRLYNNYKESICRTESLRKDSVIFAISSKSPDEPYQFKVSNG